MNARVFLQRIELKREPSPLRPQIRNSFRERDDVQDKVDTTGTHAFKDWIGVAEKRLHHEVPAIAIANKLARVA